MAKANFQLTLAAPLGLIIYEWIKEIHRKQDADVTHLPTSNDKNIT